MALRRYCDLEGCQRKNLINIGDEYYVVVTRQLLGNYSTDLGEKEFCSGDCLCDYLGAQESE